MAEERQRNSAHKKLKGFLTDVGSHSTKPLQYDEARELMIRVEEVWSDFRKVQSKLESTATTDAAFTVQEEAGEKVEKTFSDVRSKLRVILESLAPSTATASSRTTATTPGTAPAAAVRLPAISLPTFEGNFTAWMSFKDLFTSAVANNKELTGSQKLQYLKSALRGEPSNLIDYLTTTDTNYAEAWRILIDRYDNKKEIIRSHTYKLLDLKTVKFENAKDLQALVDDSLKCIRSLKVLGCPTDEWDDLLNAIVEKKLDAVTRREWAKRQSAATTSKFDELINFLKSHIRGLQAAGSSTTPHSSDRRGEKPVRVNHAGTTVGQCQICKGSHIIQECKEFLSKEHSEKSELVKKARLCFNCLKSDHMIRECCSPKRCRKCGRRHHTILHEDRGEPTKKDDGMKTVAGHHISTESRDIVMTALAHVQDKYGARQLVRIFVDNGAQSNFISEACTGRLGLVREAGRVRVLGFGNTTVGTSKGVVRTTLYSTIYKQHSLEVELNIMNKLTGRLPSEKCKTGSWNHLQGLNLADPKWHQPNLVDIVIGIKYYHKIMLTQRVPGPTDNDPVAWDTIFGWVVAGTCPTDNKSPVRVCQVAVDPIQEQLQKFWEVEEPPKKRILSAEEKACEQHFQETYRRDSSGRFIVGVPFDNAKKSTLGRSRDIAIKRLQQVERRLQRKPELLQQYAEFMKEYESLGHMSLLSQGEAGELVGTTNYLCHHFVVNDSSTTTKLRVVFDGSAPTTTGVSLNQTMLVGATLQDDLYDLLLRFRVQPVVLKADAAKMFRQFKLRDEDARFHRILWRETPTVKINEYQLNTVTYGTACAPNLATRCVQQLGLDCKEDYPLASHVLLNDAYVDDILTGTQTEDDALALFKQLCGAVATAGLELRKWTSNSKRVMDAIPESLRETSQLVFDDDELVKALGVQWHPASDKFRFKAVEFNSGGKTTKRSLLSELARVFDPLGLISCVTLRGKLLLQELWKLPVDWDDEVPATTLEKWSEYKADLAHLPNLSIPRRITFSGAERMEIHGFCDSSELGLGGLVYLRSVFPNGAVEVRFITSKTKVAPVRQVTLPRLELCAAVMLAELVAHVVECCKFEVDIKLYSDSTITLTWISASPRRWKTYVANRVATIQELTTMESWRHVAGIENPADIASRGCTVQDLCHSNFWWSGPEWLSSPELPCFPQPSICEENLEERKVEVVVNTVEVTEHAILTRFSSLTKLKRASAWYLRHLQYRILKSCSREPLTATELNVVLGIWIRKVQQQYFQEEYQRLKKCGQVSSKSKLKSLVPFIDKEGIIRVSGRLRHADIPHKKKHQIILPGQSHLTYLLIDHQHQSNFHSGFQLTWGNLQNEYWILGGRDRVRHFVRSCVRCRRFRAKAAEQLMGNLPNVRVTPARPFLHTGVDYAGPFFFKDVVGRVPKVYKGYMCLFVCLVTKAIHLEAASSLSSEVFLAALRRFVARRGLCAHMYSDCGTNFVGADKEIRSFMMTREVQDAVSRELCNKGIVWHFNPPAAPHRGGLWEAGVKSAKGHLRRVIGNTPHTFEQFTTILTQVEAVLNSRPLYSMSPDPSDMQPLTPGHFLVGAPLNAVPDMDWMKAPKNRLSQFQRIQQQLQHFWQRWSQEYLHTLQQRNKWMWERESVKVGDLVLLVEETPPGTWRMGRVLAIHPDDEGKVRLVTVKTATSTFDRVIAKLIPLMNNENDD